MAEQACLLSDEQVQQFIVSGVLTVQVNDSPRFHEEIYRQIETVFEEEGNIGNNILPRIPQIGRVFEHRAVKGALTSLLGPGYILNPHRHCHLNPPGRGGQRWHKDCYVYDHNLRHPRFHWVLAFYYPQDTTEDMGPTGILPGMQVYKTISDVDPDRTREEALSICGPVGTVALVHFDAWHRATENVSDRNRYMLKFQFARTEEPRAPAWDHQSRAWAPGIPDLHPAISRDVWTWLCGERNGEKGMADRSGDLAGGGALDAPEVEDLSDLTGALKDRSEAARLEAACALAAVGEAAVPVLVEAMREEALATVAETTAKTPDNAHGTNPTVGCAARALTAIGAPAVPALLDAMRDDHWWVRTVTVDVLARIGPEAVPAVPALMEAMRDDHWWVRRNAIEALGMIGAVSPALVKALGKGLEDGDYRVRRNAALALAKIGPEGAPAVETLVPVLEDENRYNRFYAAYALRRIGTPEAQEVLLDGLFTSRWCPITTKDDRY